MSLTDHTSPTTVVPRGDDLPSQLRRSTDRRRDAQDTDRLARAEHHLHVVRTGRLRDDGLGHPDPVRVRTLYDAVATRIDAEIAAGARVHRRLPWWFRLVPAATTALDGVVLYAFFAALFGIRLAFPQDARGVVAASFAVLGSAVTYLCLTLAGRALQGYRDPMGEISWRCLGRSTWLLTGAAVVVATALAVLMYARVSVEGQSSPFLSGGTVQAVAVVFGVVSLLGNLATVAVHALDGSVEAAFLRHAGRLLRGWERRCRRAERTCGRVASPERGLRLAPTGPTGRPEFAGEERSDR